MQGRPQAGIYLQYYPCQATIGGQLQHAHDATPQVVLLNIGHCSPIVKIQKIDTSENLGSPHKREHTTLLREQLFNYSYQHTVIHPHHHLCAVTWVLAVTNFVCDFMLISLLLNHMELVNGDLFPSLKIF